MLKKWTGGKIYIPLWFYSNAADNYKYEDVKIFTFHYGSILMCSHLMRMELVYIIYIPLWFYSNVDRWQVGMYQMHLHSTMVLF